MDMEAEAAGVTPARMVTAHQVTALPEVVTRPQVTVVTARPVTAQVEVAVTLREEVQMPVTVQEAMLPEAEVMVRDLSTFFYDFVHNKVVPSIDVDLEP